MEDYDDIGGEYADRDYEERNMPYTLLKYNTGKVVKARAEYSCCGCGKK